VIGQSRSPPTTPEIPLHSLNIHQSAGENTYVRECRAVRLQSSLTLPPEGREGGVRPRKWPHPDSGGSRGPSRSNHSSAVSVTQDGEQAGPDECAPEEANPRLREFAQKEQFSTASVCPILLGSHEAQTAKPVPRFDGPVATHRATCSLLAHRRGAVVHKRTHQHP